jgi:hypothetical protein
MTKPTILLAAIALAVLAACSSGKSSGSGGSAQPSESAPSAVTTPALNCNGQSPVWALERVKVYLLPGDRLYGKTRRGEYMCLSNAQAEGYRPARHPFHGHHRDKLFSV